MPETCLVLKLLSDAIFSRSSATIGVPSSLDAPPGAALLGFVAPELYRQHPDQAFAATHLGALRFSDGLPVVGDDVFVPLPLSWHQRKGASEVVDFSHPSHTNTSRQNFQQIRGGWVRGPGGNVQRYSVPRRSSMRTAISESGTAREGLLYGFEAITRGQCFLFRVSADDGALLDTAVRLLTEQTIHIGRSRGAEFGECSLKQDSRFTWPASAPPVDGTLRVLCLSDLALRDPHTGLPTLIPTAEACGLPAHYRFEPSRSFVRTRRYSPFNGTRARPDLERQVITAGSVLVWSNATGDFAAAQAALTRGLGEYTSAGLGQVVANPAVLDAATPSIRSFRPGAGREAPPLPADDPLAKWLQSQYAAVTKLDHTWAVANAKAKEAAMWGVPRSQWGRVRAIAQGFVQRADDKDTRAALLEALRKHADGVTVIAWGRGAGKFFGAITQTPTTAPVPVAVPAAGNQRNPNVSPAGAVADRVDNRSRQYKISFGEGLLTEWERDHGIHFARAVSILARRVVRQSDDAKTAATETGA